MRMAAWQELEERHPLDANVAPVELVLGMTNEETAVAPDPTSKQAEHSGTSPEASCETL